MKNITLFEKAINEKAKDLNAYGINPTLFWAYRNSKANGNELIDLNEVIWKQDVEDIVRTLNENGITEFTISCTFSGLIENLELFQNLGFTMGGVVKVNASYRDIFTDEQAKIPAIKMVKA